MFLFLIQNNNDIPFVCYPTGKITHLHPLFLCPARSKSLYQMLLNTCINNKKIINQSTSSVECTGSKK